MPFIKETIEIRDKTKNFTKVPSHLKERKYDNGNEVLDLAKLKIKSKVFPPKDLPVVRDLLQKIICENKKERINCSKNTSISEAPF